MVPDAAFMAPEIGQLLGSTSSGGSRLTGTARSFSYSKLAWQLRRRRVSGWRDVGQARTQEGERVLAHASRSHQSSRSLRKARIQLDPYEPTSEFQRRPTDGPGSAERIHYDATPRCGGSPASETDDHSGPVVSRPTLEPVAVRCGLGKAQKPLARYAPDSSSARGMAYLSSPFRWPPSASPTWRVARHQSFFWPQQTSSAVASWASGRRRPLHGASVT